MANFATYLHSLKGWVSISTLPFNFIYLEAMIEYIYSSSVNLAQTVKTYFSFVNSNVFIGWIFLIKYKEWITIGEHVLLVKILPYDVEGDLFCI